MFIYHNLTFNVKIYSWGWHLMWSIDVFVCGIFYMSVLSLCLNLIFVVFCCFQPGRKKVYNMEPRTPLKRQRIPVQRFQSPVLEEGAPKPKIPTEEKILLFKKGTFLAVRNPEGFLLLHLSFLLTHSLI